MAEGDGYALIGPAFGQTLDSKLRDKVLAAGAPQYHLRMLLQQSMFTIHDTKQGLEQLPGAKMYLRGYVVEPQRREALLRELDLLGIRRSTLFPDLDNLAVDVEHMVGKY